MNLNFKSVKWEVIESSIFVLMMWFTIFEYWFYPLTGVVAKETYGTAIFVFMAFTLRAILVGIRKILKQGIEK